MHRITYFAYGSNMLSGRLRERTPSAMPIGTGFVRNRRLTFDKKSIDRSGKCDMEATDSDERVYGVLFEIDAAEKPKLDRAEGRGYGYEQETIDVITDSGVKQALTYVPTCKDKALKPYHWYKNFVIAGAEEHHLPVSYIQQIRTAESTEDPDPDRRARKERMLRDFTRDRTK